MAEHVRDHRSVLAAAEKRLLIAIARRLPTWINSDHLTALGLLAMGMGGAAYALARWDVRFLWLAITALAVNWFGDSLDGTLARVRGHQRPRYGFYVDHVVDCFGVLFLLAGLALSGYMSPLVAMALLVAYFMLSIEIYLATYCLTVFRLSFWGFGPTELRLLLAIGTVALLFRPTVEILGSRHLLFDVGGIAAIAGIAVALLVAVVQNVRALYRAEPLPVLAGAAR